MYVGFNDGIEKIAFPKLKEIEGALVVEANPKLKEIAFPALVKVAKYVHIHDNRCLEKLEMPKLARVGAELSVVDNTALVHVAVATRTQPASTTAVEVKNNATATYANLFARSA